MSKESETFEFTKVVKLEDADGVAIREGAVLREINDGETGVVVNIVRKGDLNFIPLAAIGDMGIRTGHGTTRVTNRYSQWRHVPRNDQTYEQRFLSWMKTPYDHDTEGQASKDTGLAIDGIMALLPDDIVDWENGPWPDNLENALRFLVEHLEEQTRAARDLWRGMQEKYDKMFTTCLCGHTEFCPACDGSLAASRKELEKTAAAQGFELKRPQSTLHDL